MSYIQPHWLGECLTVALAVFKASSRDEASHARAGSQTLSQGLPNQVTAGGLARSSRLLEGRQRAFQTPAGTHDSTEAPMPNRGASSTSPSQLLQIILDMPQAEKEISRTTRGQCSRYGSLRFSLVQYHASRPALSNIGSLQREAPKPTSHFSL